MREKIVLEEIYMLLLAAPQKRLKRKTVRNPNDLLLTFKEADKQVFTTVSNDDIITEIVSMGIGKIKKAVQRQWDWERNEYTGNKYCVLEDVKPEERVLYQIISNLPTRFLDV